MSIPPTHSSSTPGGGWDSSGLPGCVRHPDRPTALRCVRCDRPSCPQCLREAAVGAQCVDCVAQGARTQRSAVTVAGARIAQRVVVTPALIAANIVVFLLTVVQAGSLSENFRSALFGEWSLISLLVADGGYHRLLTSGFLHYGPIHIAVNMLALWVLGRDLETVLGRGRFITVYLVSLLGGSTVVYLLSGLNTATAGASGAVFGLMGGLAVVLVRMRRSPGPALGVIALNVVISFVVPGISILGHFGGLAFGVAATAAIVYAPRERRLVVQIGAIAALLAIAAVAIVVRTAHLHALIYG